ncbi:hypothetical protein JX265_013664 [Neoarthrinium moseri]|uniref:Up-regulated during septation protein 1 domain-containing protein n=1 Tax=Neoarthrinium moseri TaxID=1658444 RepID=A0A9P9W868_9PEZI|nr:hypothetical protein JX265_013664 [Neoarthrinium moseri]
MNAATVQQSTSIIQGLWSHLENPDDANDLSVSNILDAALAQIWADMHAPPDWHMSHSEFAALNDFQHRLTETRWRSLAGRDTGTMRLTLSGNNVWCLGAVSLRSCSFNPDATTKTLGASPTPLSLNPTVATDGADAVVVVGSWDSGCLVVGWRVKVELRRTEISRTSSSEMSAKRHTSLVLTWFWLEVMQWSEVSHLQKQALGQAMTFKVLSQDDVESLSKELRYFDKRSDYLRQTYASLRAGRHKLHSSNCQYLRSARVAKFSYESIREQEAALARLVDSIDGWLSNLEHTENRRSLIRQKLLEHIAAATATMSLPPNNRGQRIPTSADGCHHSST